MKIYLAGPMRGIEDNNKEGFARYAKYLRERGIEVFSPSEYDIELDGEVNLKRPFKEYMARDLPKVLECDGVYLMPGWEHSVGACLEALVAAQCGLPCREFLHFGVTHKVYIDDIIKALSELPVERNV